MRRSGRWWLGLSWLACASWLGCNAILGNESAVFDPDAAARVDASGGDSDASGDGGPLDDADAIDGADAADASEDGAGPCVDLDDNPRHCGRCSHDCRGGACVKGRCQPVVIATDLPGPTTIAVDSTHVYWINEDTGDVFSVPIDGGAKTLLFDGPDFDAGATAGKALGFHGGNVYFGIGEIDGGVVRCSTPTCAGGPTYELTNLDVPVSLFVTPAVTLYVAETFPSSGIARCKLPCTLGTEDVVPATQSFPDNVAVSGADDLFWTSLSPSPRLLIKKQPSGAPMTIANGPIVSVVPASSEVFFIEEGVGPLAVQLDGGPPRRILATNINAKHLALDTSSVYVTDLGRDLVFSCARGGCDAGTVLADKQPSPRGITLDATFIYWANQGSIGTGGSIMRLAR